MSFRANNKKYLYNDVDYKGWSFSMKQYKNEPATKKKVFHLEHT